MSRRHSTVISRQSDEHIGEDHWLKQFQKSLLKDAVQPRNTTNLFEQINSIMNGKSKFPSVDAAVEDMKERSGLTAYLDRINKVSEQEVPAKKVTASDKKNDMVPIVIQKHRPVLQTLNNYIRDTKGNLSIPAIISHVQSIHQNDCSDAKDWDDDKLIRLVSKLNLNAKKNNPGSFENHSNLGRRDSDSDSDIDPSNNDAFFALTPVKQ